MNRFEHTRRKVTFRVSHTWELVALDSEGGLVLLFLWVGEKGREGKKMEIVGDCGERMSILHR